MYSGCGNQRGSRGAWKRACHVPGSSPFPFQAMLAKSGEALPVGSLFLIQGRGTATCCAYVNYGNVFLDHSSRSSEFLQYKRGEFAKRVQIIVLTRQSTSLHGNACELPFEIRAKYEPMMGSHV